MAKHAGENERYRLLDEFVCQATPNPSVFPAEGLGPTVSRGENIGMQVWEELALASTAKPGPEVGPTKEDSRGTDELRLSPGGPFIEIIIGRDFASYTATEQERLLSALKELLLVTREVRVVQRAADR